MRLAQDAWHKGPTLGYLGQGYQDIVEYRSALGLALSIGYGVFTDHGDYRGIGRNLDGRLAWFYAGYYGDLTLAKATAIPGVSPGKPYDKGGLQWHLGNDSSRYYLGVTPP